MSEFPGYDFDLIYKGMFCR